MSNIVQVQVLSRAPSILGGRSSAGGLILRSMDGKYSYASRLKAGLRFRSSSRRGIGSGITNQNRLCQTRCWITKLLSDLSCAQLSWARSRRSLRLRFGTMLASTQRKHGALRGFCVRLIFPVLRGCLDTPFSRGIACFHLCIHTCHFPGLPDTKVAAHYNPGGITECAVRSAACC